MPEIHSLIDLGMCVTLWVVQLVIYPSFLFIKDCQLVDWHRAYTFRVSFIIMPLMISQLALVTMSILSTSASLIDWLILVLVITCWLLTFFISVPMHRKIEHGNLDIKVRQRLIKTNWPRTILWTLIFFIGLCKNLSILLFALTHTAPLYSPLK